MINQTPLLFIKTNNSIFYEWGREHESMSDQVAFWTKDRVDIEW